MALESVVIVFRPVWNNTQLYVYSVGTNPLAARTVVLGM